jgi:ElaB/YqjD/DUF883 family membrane-anchored ribosome-binding protein
MSLLQRLFSNISDVDVAQSEVDGARGKLMATIEHIQERLAPHTLMDEAVDQVKARSAALAQNAGDVVRERPVTVAATIAGLILLLAHKPLAKLLARIFGRAKETPAPQRRSSPNRPPAHPQPASEG